MADRIDKVGAVHRVEMKIPDAVIDEIENLFGGDRRGDEFSRLRIVVEPFETIGKPLRDRSSGPPGELRRLLETLHRNDARDDRDVDSRVPHLIEKTQIDFVFEKELGDRPARSGIDLGFQDIDIGVGRDTFGVAFRIGGHRDFEIGDLV